MFSLTVYLLGWLSSLSYVSSGIPPPSPPIPPSYIRRPTTKPQYPTTTVPQLDGDFDLEGSGEIGSAVIPLYITEVPEIQNCPDATCANGTETSRMNRGCFCDNICVAYHDCCVDKVLQDPDLLPSMPIPNLWKVATCGYFAWQTMHFRVLKCPPSFRDRWVKGMCENIPDLQGKVDDDVLLSVPVTDPNFGIVFRNKYCAECNGVLNFVFWTDELNCRKIVESPEASIYNKVLSEHGIEFDTALGKEVDVLTPYDASGYYYEGIYDEDTSWKNVPYEDDTVTWNSPVDRLIEQSECHHNFLPPAHLPAPRSCSAPIDTCPDDWNGDEIKNNCESYNELVYHQGELYKNPYCAACRNISEHDLSCDEHFGYEDIRERPQEHLYGTLISFKVLVDYNNPSSVLITSPSQLPCTQNQVRDPKTHQCRNTTCEYGYTLHDGKCVKDSGSVKDDRDDFSFEEEKKTDLNLDSKDNNIQVISCAKVKVNPGEYKMFQNRSVLVFANNVLLSPDSYSIPDGKHLLMCADDFTSSYHGRLPADRAQGILTTLGLSVSICSLAILIAVYVSFSALRNLAGKCVLTLAVVLLISQALFVSGMLPTVRRTHIPCMTLGILLHYSFLATFFWMNVMAYDVCRTFAKKYTLATAQKTSYRFIFYCMYAFGAPSLLILFSVSVDNVQQDFIPKPDYGRGLCWFNNQEALLYLFTVPCACLLFANYVFFLYTVYNICTTRQQVKMTEKQRTCSGQFKRVVVYAKLSTLLGLTWVFGYFGVVTELDVFWYLFIVFSSLQGLFMCVSFVFTRKVLRHFSQLFGTGEEEKKTETSVNAVNYRLSTSSAVPAQV